MTNLTVIILTFNEEKHITRCIKSLESISENIFIIDSQSTDNTVAICESLGAKVYQNKWKNYSVIKQYYRFFPFITLLCAKIK